MYFPEGLKKSITKSGGIFVVGVSTLSLVLGAFAFGWIGVGVAGGIVVLLFFVEVYRDADRFLRSNRALTAKVSELEDEQLTAVGIRGENADLRQQIEAWKESHANPPFSLEELLEALTIQHGVIQVVLKHRAIQSKIGPAHVTSIELTADQYCRISAVSTASSSFDEMEVALIGTSQHSDVSVGRVVDAADGSLRAEFSLAGFPGTLVEELRGQGMIKPSGFSLVLAGTVDPRYKGVTDESLQRLDAQLDGLARDFSATMSSSTATGADGDAAVLQELEEGADDAAQT